MSNNEHRLIADHKEVVKTLRLYKNITLINTSGKPVDEYDIEYKLQGYTITHDGRVTIAKSHRVKIKIPFGYPYFPPTIRPLSPIFHPEIDENVVPIANYWEDHKSLPQLMLHIGNMICGKDYNLEDSFNDDAAQYYRKHQSRLPLDSLKRIDKKKKDEDTETSKLKILKPILLFVTLAAIVLIVVGGGRFAYEKWRINQSTTLFVQAEKLLHDKDFRRAQAAALRAQDNVETFFILRQAGKSMERKIAAFLQSKPLTEGLKGKIKYGDQFIAIEQAQQLEFVKELIVDAQELAQKNDIEKAVPAYEKALEYAQKHTLDSEIETIERELSRIRLKLLIAASEEAHERKNWDWAVERHTALLNYIEKNKKYFEDIARQIARTKYLLLIDKIAFYTQQASAAENRNDLETALKYHNSLIDLIGKSDSQNNATMQNTLMDSLQKAAILTEKINIERKRAWLITNYREIFQAHYPTILPSTLKNPQAIFVKYDDNSMVFDLNCLEKGVGSVVRLRLFYQYNPETEIWSAYDGEIESDT